VKAGETTRISRERALAHDSRVALVAAMRAASEPLDASALAEAVALHVNTVRSHLRQLEAAGLVRRGAETRSEPGRPRVLYTLTASEPPAGDGHYALLAEMLSSYIANNSPDPAATAEEIGRQWGRHLTPTSPPFARSDGDEALATLLDLLDGLGFGCHVDSDPLRIEFRHCPFRELAERHPEVTCSLHLGLLRGALAQLEAPVRVDDLRPFVDPDRCLADLRATR
jgi:predicted ArsR family transcriptional regulator